MTIREEIMQVLDDQYLEIGYAQNDWYSKLKECIKFTRESMPDSGNLDTWFHGIINSLYYKPNKYFLLLKGKDCRLCDFFTGLFPDEGVFSGTLYVMEESNIDAIKYNFLLGLFECPERVHIDLTLSDDFAIWTLSDAKMFKDGTPQPVCDKRLISYCGVTEKWHNPPNKNCILLEVESIDWEKFNAIPKLQLWQEIFNKFK